MFPRLLELGPLTIYTYGLLLAAAYLTGLKVATVRASRRGIDSARVLDLGIWIIIAAIVGAKLLLLAVDFQYFREHPAEIFSLVRSGGVFFGGILVAVPVAIWYVRRHNLPLWPLGDAIAPGIALAHAVGRLGCFFGGCCYGRPTTMPWGVTFHDAFAHDWVGTPLNVALHPTQLYEAALELIIMGVLLLSERKGRPFPGRTFWLYGLLYSVARFCVEYFRGDQRGSLLGLSTSQFISVVLVPVSLVFLVRLARASSKAEAPTGDASGRRSRGPRRGKSR